MCFISQYGYTPLMVARDEVKVVQLLLDAGAIKDIQNKVYIFTNVMNVLCAKFKFMPMICSTIYYFFKLPVNIHSQ